jgi:hypothetical protein
MEALMGIVHAEITMRNSGTPDVLLGAIPLEDMDLVVNPAKQELIGAHGDEVITSVV